MANTDKGEYTRIPNRIIEALYSSTIHFSPIQSAVLLFIIRRTFGWNKYSDYISLNSMAKAIGKDRANVSRAVNDLMKMGVLNVDRRLGRSSDISINDPEKWDRPV